MKIKKEYIVLIVIIAALSGYLYFNRTDRVHYTLPDISAFEPDTITRIEIVSGQSRIVLNKKDGTWLVGEQEYPADAGKTSAMLNTLGDLAITDLVSESKNYILYDLEDDKNISVKAYAGSTPVRSFAIGKTAPTHSHTFIRLDGDDRVYQAKGSFRNDFETTAAGLRDKRVLTFKPGEITAIAISAAGREISLTREDLPSEDTGEQTGTARWKDANGNTADTAAIDQILNTLGSLDCQEYLDGKEKADLKSPATSIRLTGTKEYSLSLFAAEDNKRPASSSESAYVFVLPDYRMEGIEKSAEDLLGESGKE